jgi:hypothetical protein
VLKNLADILPTQKPFQRIEEESLSGGKYCCNQKYRLEKDQWFIWHQPGPMQ